MPQTYSLYCSGRLPVLPEHVPKADVNVNIIRVQICGYPEVLGSLHEPPLEKPWYTIERGPRDTQRPAEQETQEIRPNRDQRKKRSSTSAARNKASPASTSRFSSILGVATIYCGVHIQLDICLDSSPQNHVGAAPSSTLKPPSTLPMPTPRTFD